MAMRQTTIRLGHDAEKWEEKKKVRNWGQKETQRDSTPLSLHQPRTPRFVLAKDEKVT